MNRRTLLQSVAVLPIIGTGQTQEIRTNLLVDQDIPVHMIVSSHAGELIAERFRLDWAGQPFETMGEWYLQSTETRKLPPELATMPGTLTFHTARYGEAGEHQEYLVGAFRRGQVSIIVRIREDNEPIMLLIAEHIAAQNQPTLFESLWSSVSLKSFIPSENVLGFTTEPGTTFWP